VAIARVCLGVVWLTWQAGQFPWIALILAFSFGFYGLIRKTASLGPLEGLTLETAVLFPFALAYLAWLEYSGQGAFVHGTLLTRVLLVCTGPITAIPLLCFAAAARRIPLSALGILQYIAPTIQLGLGVLLYGEPFPLSRLLGYLVIWTALLIYTIEGAWQARLRTQSRARALSSIAN
jgi:chloramphenicol-sensitive protein RarD